MNQSEITIACVLRTPAKSKNRNKQKFYGNDDVVRLKKGVDNFLKMPHEFVCLTDRDDVETNTIKLIGEPTETPGWWAKLELFRPELFKRPVLYIDLDMIICGDLDEMVRKFKGNPFMLLGNSRKTGFGSGMIYFEGKHNDLWEKYIADPKYYQMKYSKKSRLGDQAFIEDNTPFRPMNETVNRNWFQRFEYDTVPHPDSKILVCVGKQNKLHKQEFQDNPWVLKYWRNI